MATYTIRDICNRYGVHEQSVLGWIHNGELRAVNVGRDLTKKKPRWRITQEAVDAFEVLRAATPIPPRTRSRRSKSSDVIEFHK